MASSARTSTDREHSDFEHIHVTSTPQSLSKAVHARRDEYTRPRKIKVKIGSWNVAACPGTEKDLGGWFVQGKGIDKRLAGLQITEGINEDGSQNHVESVEAQEARRTKKASTIPLGDKGAIVGGDEIDLYVLGLQEVVDLASATQYIGRVYADLEPAYKWRKALTEALPPGYVLVAEQQLSGMLLFIFASPDVAPTISSVSTVSIGTGVMGYLGNKGAVTTRIVLGETTRMVFVNSHLASGNDPAHFERRCWDVTQVLQRTKFEPISRAGVLDDGQEGIGEEDFAFWFGDLNFRLEGLPGDDIRRLLMLHTKGEYDVGAKSRKKIDGELSDNDAPIIIHSVESDSDSDGESVPKASNSFDEADDQSSNTLPDPDDFVQDPSQDPASLQATLDSLLPHDQLRRAMKSKKAFHDGWREGPVTFLPTYKYDVGSMGMFDSSEKKRSPSWCDRILFRTRKDKTEYDMKSREEALAKIRDEELRAKGVENALEEENVLFDYNPDEDGAEDAANSLYDEYDEGEDSVGQAVITKEGYVDRIHLDVYTSHQRVLSSDHKPLDAVFTLEYDAVVPELKAKIHQEVARELDRAENEGRPGITLVVDNNVNDTPPSSNGGTAENVSVDFGSAAYGQHKTKALTIANTSQVSSTFSFVERPTESGEPDRISPPWLSVSFAGSDIHDDSQSLRDAKREVTLEPGDVVTASLDLFIDDVSTVRALNEGTKKLEDVLVLRVTDGRDHFVPIHASWLQSCLGRSVDELIRIPEGGVRSLLPRRNGAGGVVNRGQDVCWSAPREIFKICEVIELLTERVIADSNMLEDAALPKDSPGWPFDEHTWRLKDLKHREVLQAYVFEALDSDKNLNDSFPPEIPAFEKLEIISEVLIKFLRSLKDGVVPAPLWEKLDSDMAARGTKAIIDIEEKKAWVLDVLSSSPNHNISFVFLTSMLSRVAGELAPIPNNWNPPQVSGTRRSIESVRRSLSWKGRAPPLPNDPAVLRREQVEKVYADVFKDVIFKHNSGSLKDKERKAGEERRKEMLEAFLKGGREI